MPWACRPRFFVSLFGLRRCRRACVVSGIELFGGLVGDLGECAWCVRARVDCWSSEEVHTVDAWARAGDEGRGKLRKASGSCKHAEIRGCPNGETRRRSYSVMPRGKSTQGTETSKYLQEEKSKEIPLVAASERGRAQTVGGDFGGVVGPQGKLPNA